MMLEGFGSHPVSEACQFYFPYSDLGVQMGKKESPTGHLSLISSWPEVFFTWSEMLQQKVWDVPYDSKHVNRTREKVNMDL